MEKAKGFQIKRNCFTVYTDVNFPGLPFFTVTNFVTKLEITEISLTKLNADVQLPSKPLKHWCKYLLCYNIHGLCSTDSK